MENTRELADVDPHALQIAFTLLQWQEAKASVELDGGTHVREEGVSYDMRLVGNAKAYSKFPLACFAQAGQCVGSGGNP